MAEGSRTTAGYKQESKVTDVVHNRYLVAGDKARTTPASGHSHAILLSGDNDPQQDRQSDDNIATVQGRQIDDNIATIQGRQRPF